MASPSLPPGTPHSLYRRKNRTARIVEARKLGQDYDEDCAIVKWCGGKAIGIDGSDALMELGGITARAGDWIVNDDSGFCVADGAIFEALWEPVSSMTKGRAMPNTAKDLADEIDSVGMEACEWLRDNVVAQLRRAATLDEPEANQPPPASPVTADAPRFSAEELQAESDSLRRQLDAAMNMQQTWCKAYQRLRERAVRAEAERDARDKLLKEYREWLEHEIWERGAILNGHVSDSECEALDKQIATFHRALSAFNTHVAALAQTASPETKEKP